MTCLKAYTKTLGGLHKPQLGLFLVVLFTALSLLVSSWCFASEPNNPLLRKFTIKIDPSTLNPPTKWQVPGITPLIWIHDPASTVAYSTTEPKELKLKPGKYQFGTFTFSFFFNVKLSGTLEYDKSLDQCVKGRGTQNLTILCSHTQPYPQDPDYPDAS